MERMGGMIQEVGEGREREKIRGKKNKGQIIERERERENIFFARVLYCSL